MALIAHFLIDTSAAARMHHATVSERLAPLIDAALVATCPTLDAEALASARNHDDYRRLREDRRRSYEYLPLEDRHWQRAFDAQETLARTGRRRAVGIVNLLSATLAAEHRLTVVHYDADFDVAAEVIPFSGRWVVPRGSVP